MKTCQNVVEKIKSIVPSFYEVNSYQDTITIKASDSVLIAEMIVCFQQKSILFYDIPNLDYQYEYVASLDEILAKIDELWGTNN